MMLHRTFRAMGTDVELLVDATADERSERALDQAESEFERLEQVMSRFRDDSELSTLNRDGWVVAASPDLVRVVDVRDVFEFAHAPSSGSDSGPTCSVDTSPAPASSAECSACQARLAHFTRRGNLDTPPSARSEPSDACSDSGNCPMTS